MSCHQIVTQFRLAQVSARPPELLVDRTQIISLYMGFLFRHLIKVLDHHRV